MMENSQRESVGDGDATDNLNPFFDKGMITKYFQCPTTEASYLCIDSAITLMAVETDEDGFSIGGTFDKETQEFWFVGHVTQSMSNTYLFNVSVVFRKPGRISISLPNVQNDLKDRIVVKNTNDTEKCCLIRGPTKQYTYRAFRANETIPVMTFCFTRNDLEKLGHMPVLVPCSIQVHDSDWIDPDFIKKHKMETLNKINESLYIERKNEGDFFLESATGNKFCLHLFVAAAHSPVLMNIITKENKKTYSVNMADEYVEMLVGFLYKGSVDNFTVDQAIKALELAHILKLPGLSKLAEKKLYLSLEEDNAVDIAILAKKYGLPKLSEMVFHFMKHHPNLLSGSGIQNLTDIDLVKSMLQHIAKPCHCNEFNHRAPNTLLLTSLTFRVLLIILAQRWSS